MTQKFLDTTTHNIAWLYKRDQDDELEISPPFQRNPVWSDAQKSYLIDTILRGYPIPEIYMQEFTNEDGEDEYIVVDGQQRLRACIDFINNRFILTGSGKQPVLHEGCLFDDLPGADRKKIFNYNFVVRKLPEMSDDELRAIFARLNRNVVALNAQELRHSVYWGEFITTMEDLSDDDRWALMGVFTANDIRRMLDVEFISEIALAVIHGPQNKKSSLDKWYAAYERDFPEKARIKSVFNKVLGEITQIMPEISHTRWSKKSDFYTLFEYLAGTVQKLPYSADVREKIGKKLKKFGEKVDSYIADPEQTPAPPATIRGYAAAVSKAASDLGSRKARLSNLIKEVPYPS